MLIKGQLSDYKMHYLYNKRNFICFQVMKKLMTNWKVWQMGLKMRRAVVWFLLFSCCLLAYQYAVSLWPSVETAIDSYIDEKPHHNYDYYEDLPSDVIYKKNRPITVSLLKKFKSLVGSSLSNTSSSSSSSPASTSKGLKVVLFWTSWFQKSWWVRLRGKGEEGGGLGRVVVGGGRREKRGGGGLDLEGAHCPETRCHFTHDKSRIQEAAAVLFQSQRAFVEKLPSSRTSRQRWVWVHVEPPTTSDHALYTLFPEQGPEVKELRDLSPIFNWTMTYHPTSDIMEPYGALFPIDQRLTSAKNSTDTNTADSKWSASKLGHSLWSPSMRPALLDTSSDTYRKYQHALLRSPSVDELMDSTWEPNLQWDRAKTYSWSFLATQRPRLVAWAVSHCPTVSKREDYVTQLQDHITVDVYGSCGAHRCGSKQDHRDERCWKQIFTRKYLFYLAFENSMCDAYVTEKLWRPLMYGLVPIVLGGANYSHFLPPHSYINALDYSPEDLGRFLMDLQDSPDDYIQYHLWRVFWRASLRPPLCEICHKIHNDNTQAVQHDIPGWWRSVGQCHNPAQWPMMNLSS